MIAPAAGLESPIRTLLCSLLLLIASPAPAQEARAPTDLDLERYLAPAVRSFADMKQARLIRALLPHSRTLFYTERGKQSGISADSVHEFERWLNHKYRRSLGSRPITIALIPTPRDEILERIALGRGDIAVANLTITPLRRELVDFSIPELENVSEIVVTGPGAPQLEKLADLSGYEVHVREASSYYESLLALNARFEREGRRPVRIRLVPDELEDEDLVEMLSAGLIAIIVVDDWKAKLWARLLPKITLHPGLALRTGGEIAWAFRKDSPDLAREINAFLASRAHRGALTEWQLLQTRRRLERIENSTRSAEWKKFESMRALFQKYGERYGIDPLMLAAQGYRESGLNPEAHSHKGAVGVMQVLPSTGRNLGVGDVHKLEPNIHAGAKYLRELIDRYFNDPGIDPQNDTLFAMAAYNAGPTRISQLRRRAKREGFDPDIWFNNVEVTVSRALGREPVAYVRDIYKYYAAYKLQLEARAENEAARNKLRQREGG